MPYWMLFIGGAGLGARLMYLLDPSRGRRRRAVLRQRSASRVRRSGRYLDTSTRDLERRLIGTVARGRLRLSEARHRVGLEVSEAVLEERVRAKLGRYVSHLHAIEVHANQGRVTLSGPILAREAASAVRAVYGVPGVREVQDLLEIHRKADLPKLEGGRARRGMRPDLLQQNWSPATRLLAGSLGAGALLSGKAKPLAGILGLLVFFRATTNRGFRELLGIGRRRMTKIHKTLNVQASVSEVFAFWSDFRNFPKFIKDVYDVQVSEDGLRSHWKVAGPAGVPVGFDSVVTRYEPNHLISWQTPVASVFPNRGTVHFGESPEGTRIDLEFSYLPPGGELAESAERFFGIDPKSRLDEFLAEMKTLLERGPSERQLKRML